MPHEMEDLKHNDTFKAEHAEYSRESIGARPVVLKAVGQKGSGKTTLLVALASILKAAGYPVSLREGDESESDSHTLVVGRVLAPTPLGRLCGLTQPHPSEPGQVEFRATERELKAAHNDRDYWQDVTSGYAEALQFYADPKNWVDVTHWEGDLEMITPKAVPVLNDTDGGRPCDCGDTARAALGLHPGKEKREHTLFRTCDADAPEAIKDRNGEVVLGLCKICNKAEVELSEQCFFDSEPNRGMAVIEASGPQGCGKSLLVKILAAALSAVGIKSISGEDAGPDNIGQHHLVIDTSDKKALANLELTIQRSGLKDFEAMAVELKEARGERDAWKRVAERAGVCMTCALGLAALDNGTPGCTDCLNSGWHGGAPAGFVPDNGPEVMQFPREQGVKVVNTNGKRWRLQGEGWIMQPEGHVSADQAREICERAVLAFTPSELTRPVAEEPAAPMAGDGGPVTQHDLDVLDWVASEVKGKGRNRAEAAILKVTRLALAYDARPVAEEPAPSVPVNSEAKGAGWKPNFNYDDEKTWPPQGHVLGHLFHDARVFGGWKKAYFEELVSFFYPSAPTPQQGLGERAKTIAHVRGDTGTLKGDVAYFMQQFRKTFFNDCTESPAEFTPNIVSQGSWFDMQSKMILAKIVGSKAEILTAAEPKPETLTEARLARVERWFTDVEGGPFPGRPYARLNERVEAARKREA